MTAGRTTIIVLTAVICLMASSALAVQPRWGNSCWWRDGRIAAELRLTRYEIDQLEHMQRSVNQRSTELNNILVRAHRNVSRQLDSRRHCRNDIEREIRTIEQATAELAGIRIRHSLDVRGLLGPVRFNSAMRYVNWHQGHQPDGPVVYSVTN